MHLLTHFSDHISQLGYILNACFELSKKAMMDLTQVYKHSNHHEATFQLLPTNAKRTFFSIQSCMQTLQNNLTMMNCLTLKCQSSKCRKIDNQKSRPLMTWLIGVQCQKGSYRITMLRILRDLPTLQTTLIRISIWFLSTIERPSRTLW